ncbi:hypothetical protein GCM10023165_30690 [Variovorax defluvii]|uniref:Bacterial virulence protein VirB8 domain-containing protein n=1 Tax=Variovorax defluvii TaxID=913761 RepID=A0ABP8HWN7_9BURK
MNRDPALEKYLQEARSWELDRARHAERSARIAWTVAGIAGATAILAVAAVTGLTPLKQPVPVVKLDSGKDKLAQVRFTRYTRAGGTGDEQASHWVSTIEFAYVQPSRDDKWRSLNPLGFRVVEYRREPEVAAAGVAATPPIKPEPR